MRFGSPKGPESLFIDGAGRIMRTDPDDPTRRRDLALPEHPTQTELTRYLGARPKVEGQIPAAEMAALKAKLPGTLAGAVICANPCIDAHVSQLNAWRMDDGSYTPILLAQFGQRACKNLSPEAQAILSWLGTRPDTLVMARGLPFCELTDGACVLSELCRVADPREGCVSPMGCSSVPSCDWCPGTCVTKADGSKRCVPSNADCSSRRCPCRDLQPCAGGADYCRDLPDGSMTCAAPNRR